MISPKKDGGNVFPHDEIQVLFEKGHEHCAQKIMGGFSAGLSVRQAYKLAALQGDLASQSIESGHYTNYLEFAKRCGEIADAMCQEDLAHAQREEGTRAKATSSTL